MTNNSEFAGKNVLISGGTSGINLGIAKVFAGLAANVAVFGRDQEKAKSAAAEIDRAGPGQTVALTADVRNAEAVASLIAEVREHFGPLDVVIAGAAGNFAAPAIDISPNGFKAVVDIDLLGTYNVFWSAFSRLRKSAASLIAITAPQAELPMPFQSHVCAAKAGINMLIKCLALEWGPAGVRVNGISPGPTAGTVGVDRLAPTEKDKAAVVRRMALQRFGEASEIGELAAYLSSSAAGYITGGIANCDGGMVLGDASVDCLTTQRR